MMRTVYNLKHLGKEIGKADISEEELLELLTGLPGRTQEFVKRRFGLEGYDSEGLRSIGDDFGVTDARVQQVVSRAIRRLRYELWKIEESGKVPSDMVPIGEAGFSKKLFNILRRAHLYSLQEVAKMSRKELLGLPYFGPYCLRQVEEVLGRHGLKLAKRRRTAP